MDETQTTPRNRRKKSMGPTSDVKIYLVDEKGTDADECGLWMPSRQKRLLIRNIARDNTTGG
jgi:hypothetical protein